MPIDETVPLRTSSDVICYYGDDTRLVDLTGAVETLERLTISAGGSSDRIAPIHNQFLEVIPMSIRHGVTLAGFSGVTIEQCDHVDVGESVLVVLLSQSGVGWLLPSAIRESFEHNAQRMTSNQRVERVTAMAKPTGRSRYIAWWYFSGADGAVDIVVHPGQEVWFAGFVAGSIGGENVSVGFTRVALATGNHAIVGARGLLVICSIAETDE